VRIRSLVHKGLRRLYEENSPKGLSADTVDKLRKMLAFLDAMETPEELYNLPFWKAHVLTGDRKGTWSLHDTRNRRLTFRIEDEEIIELNFEDYH
jgi:proteic killer suppression protein